MRSPEAYKRSKRVEMVASLAAITASLSSIYFSFNSVKTHSKIRALEQPVYIISDTGVYSTTAGTTEQIDRAQDDFKNSNIAFGASLLALAGAESVLKVQDVRSRRQRQAASTIRLAEFDVTMEMHNACSKAILNPQGYSRDNSPELHHWEGTWDDEEQEGFPLGSQHRSAGEISFPSPTHRPTVIEV